MVIPLQHKPGYLIAINIEIDKEHQEKITIYCVLSHLACVLDDNTANP